MISVLRVIDKTEIEILLITLFKFPSLPHCTLSFVMMVCHYILRKKRRENYPMPLYDITSHNSLKGPLCEEGKIVTTSSWQKGEENRTISFLKTWYLKEALTQSKQNDWHFLNASFSFAVNTHTSHTLLHIQWCGLIYDKHFFYITSSF